MSSPRWVVGQPARGRRRARERAHLHGARPHGIEAEHGAQELRAPGAHQARDAQHLAAELVVRYRVNRTSAWYEGIIENLSQSGVLFSGPQPLPVNALIEMVFEMPEEISGRKNSNVVCQGRVMRAKDAREKDKSESEDENIGLAASIVDYKFIH